MATTHAAFSYTPRTDEPPVLSWRSAAQLGSRPVGPDPAGAQPGSRAGLTATLTLAAAAASVGLNALRGGVSGGLLGTGETTGDGGPLLIGWARDFALALPLIAAAVVLSAAATRPRRGCRPNAGRVVLQAVVTAAAAALAVSLATTARVALGGVSSR